MEEHKTYEYGLIRTEESLVLRSSSSVELITNLIVLTLICSELSLDKVLNKVRVEKSANNSI